VTKACVRRPGAAASVERRRRERRTLLAGAACELAGATRARQARPSHACTFSGSGMVLCVRSFAVNVSLLRLQRERVVTAVNGALESTHGFIPVQQSQFGMLLAAKFSEYVYYAVHILIVCFYSFVCAQWHTQYDSASLSHTGAGQPARCRAGQPARCRACVAPAVIT
jgi:hypothetical protein